MANAKAKIQEYLDHRVMREARILETWNDGIRNTEEIVKRWSAASPEACLVSNSVKYLQRTGQLQDLDFVLSHINDVNSAFVVAGREVLMAAPHSRLAHAAQFDEVAA